MSRGGHLTRRFVGALRPGGPRSADVDWVRGVLTDREYDLWAAMMDHDRRHAVAVARRVERTLARADRPAETRWLAAALLHDVGKLDAGLGVLGRVGATLAGATAGHDDAAAWSGRRGIRRRVGLYLRHPELGADRIRLVGGREEAAAWAAAHHRPDAPDVAGLPPTVAAALLAADDD